MIVFREGGGGSSTMHSLSMKEAGAEFLKAAVMQSHNCALNLRICGKFVLMNAKQEKITLL